MSQAPSSDRMELPARLRRQLLEFRRRVWTIKLAEAIGTAVSGVMIAYFVVFLSDRFVDTPGWIRIAILASAAATCLTFPHFFRHWVWNHRKLDQLARLLSRRMPSLGDQLLGIIELVRNDLELSRSRSLCEAAIHQVDDDAGRHDFLRATPHSRHRQWTLMAFAALGVAVTLTIMLPDAARNAWHRFLAPWNSIARYTFTSLEPLPDRLVVAHGEPFSVVASVAQDSKWRPDHGNAWVERQPSMQAALIDGRYTFELAPQVTATSLGLRIGDALHDMRIEPMTRPELASVEARVRLPAYLELGEPVRKDARGGSVSLVRGSRVTLVATSNRTLSNASIDELRVEPDGPTIQSEPMVVDGDKRVVFQWRDEFGLTPREPFALTIHGREDEPPTVSCDDLPRQRVILETEPLSFQVVAQDDFGVKRVGMEWQGMESSLDSSSAPRGERILSAGAPAASDLRVSGTFVAQSLGISPRPIQLRIYVEDYLPGRERVYSAPYLFYVLDARRHAIWLTEQLSKWHRQSLEVRDREMQLYETNKQFRSLAAHELNQAETRRRIENQAAAERANGRRLASLTSSGEDLVQQATRNPEFGVGHLEKWADMLRILKDISANRMPTVADLLNDASRAPAVAANAKPSPPGVGQVRSLSSTGSQPEDPADAARPKPAVPAIVDVESSQQPKEPGAESQPPPAGKGAPSLSLPVTTLVGGASSEKESCPAGQKVDEAVDHQEQLLAEFDKIADELNRVLANLEGSTLVKRLKAASRTQYELAGHIGERIPATFGLAPFRHEELETKKLESLSQREATSSHEVSIIMDDMQAYFDRRRFVNFKNVLADMQKSDVVGGLRQIGDELPKETGLSIAQCEYWSDALDRWAEELVDPTSGGT